MEIEEKKNPLKGIPTPPESLLMRHALVSENIPQPEITRTELPPTPQSVDYFIYESALEDRRQAETSYAEIYSQYVEVVAFNENLLRKIRRFDEFKKRVRAAYDRAKLGDQIVLDSLKASQRNLVATEKALGDLQIENESLRMSVTSHEEAFMALTKRLGQTESRLEATQKQFQNLAEEFDQRGTLLQEADRNIKGYLYQIESQNAAIRELQDRFSKVRDENLMLQSKLRETQIHEAGIATLNGELTDSITKLQKQVHELEDRLDFEKNRNIERISELEKEVERLRETKKAEQLVEQSKLIQSGHRIVPPTPPPKSQLDQFYSRWSQIIGELSSHSSAIQSIKPNKPGSEANDELISERGDLA